MATQLMQPPDKPDDRGGLVVLFLGPDTSPVLPFLRQREREVIATTDPIDVEFVRRVGAEFAVSHGYRHMVRRPVLDHLKDRVVNLHISYLPWNRGADPNFWSFVEDTPKGVSIHYMDAGIDTGDLIAQRRMEFAPTETLRTSYDQLQAAVCELFVSEWPRIRVGRCRRVPQAGTSHRVKDKQGLLYLLDGRGYDTPVSVLIEYAAETQMSAAFRERYHEEVAALPPTRREAEPGAAADGGGM